MRSEYPFGEEFLRQVRRSGLVNVPVADASIYVHSDEFVQLDVKLILTRDQFKALFDGGEE